MQSGQSESLQIQAGSQIESQKELQQAHFHGRLKLTGDVLRAD